MATEKKVEEKAEAKPVDKFAPVGEPAIETIPSAHDRIARLERENAAAKAAKK